MRALELEDVPALTAPALGSDRVAFPLLDWIDRVLVVAAMIATVASGLVLTYSVIVRDLLHWSTDWQDEVSIFLLVGATFLSAPWVQARRGHIAIEAVAGMLSPRAQRVRQLFADFVCLGFGAVFGIECWKLLIESIQSGEVTDSVFAPPLWFPYGMMTAGITLLALRFALQVAQDVSALRAPLPDARASDASLSNALISNPHAANSLIPNATVASAAASDASMSQGHGV